jgi:HD-GYP domain-containing protein (c-di-GMP phosphodiesterase class II)
MSAVAGKVSTQDIVLGMYIAKLDRPWLETPFLFQGFRITDEKEIRELQRYCDHVFVEHPEPAQGSRAPPPALVAPEKRGWWPFRLPFARRQKRAAPEAEPETSEQLRDLSTVAEELPQARAIYAQAASTFGEAIDRIREGGALSAQILKDAVSPIVDSLLRNHDAMTWLARIKRADDYTYGHSISCAIYAIGFGRHLGLPKEDLQILGVGGLLLDVGKTRVSKDLLNKHEALTDAETAAVRKHVEHGVDIVSKMAGIDAAVLAMVRSHHERYDGSGYPQRLKGMDIPVFARLAGIVDFYDAVITKRPYAAPISPFDAVRELLKRAGNEFQREMVDRFIQAVGVFPDGALVELSTGEVGIVVDQNPLRRLRPKVMIVLGPDKRPKDKLVTIDLRDCPAEPKEKNAVWIDKGLESGAYGLDAADYYL